MSDSDSVLSQRRVLRLLPVLLLIMAAFGFLFSKLPVPAASTFFGGVLILANGVALVLLIVRSRESGPEQRGWILLAVSALLLTASNFAWGCLPLDPGSASSLEWAYLGLQLTGGFLQVWAITAWPFRASALEFRRPLNVTGSLLCSSAILLLLWGTILFQNPPNAGPRLIYHGMIVQSLRVASVAGIALYFLASDPRRMRGPLGWFLIGTLMWGSNILLARTHIFDSNAILQPSPLWALSLAAPFSLILMAWSRAPLEAAEGEAPISFELVEWLIYLPFTAVSLLLVLFALHRKEHLLAVSLGFLAICALFLARHIFLLKEAHVTREVLEVRVRARTHDLEEMQTTLMRTERMNAMASLGAGLTHDLNNALNIVKSYAQLSLMHLEGGEVPKISDLERILVAVDQSAALTQRLMAFGRQDARPPETIDLHHETADLEPLLRMLLPRNISLKLSFKDPLTPVLGSRDRIEQMLVNLVSNARDALPQGGHISVELDREPAAPAARIYLRVTDDGPGMPPEVLDRIFQPFFTTKAAGKGTGLGLSSVRFTMEELGGTVEVQSKPGSGTTFTLWFPPQP